jgi:hypothetical protein
MAINRRKASSSEVASQKKISGHIQETDYAQLISADTLSGTQKGDVRDQKGRLHSVKSGKKWQIFLYRPERIKSCTYLNVLLPCLDVFPKNYSTYEKDRVRCIEYKEKYVKDHGRSKAKLLKNEDVIHELGPNSYVTSKFELSTKTSLVCSDLKDKVFLRNFLDESIFNSAEVSYLVVKDSTYLNDNFFKIFDRNDVLDVLVEKLTPEVSKAGHVPEDFNVEGQKTLLCYKNKNGKNKNIVEIEVRNDGPVHYRELRFNMYSRDALLLLLESDLRKVFKQIKQNVFAYGAAVNF